jgi:hypothetical protein
MSTFGTFATPPRIQSGAGSILPHYFPSMGGRGKGKENLRDLFNEFMRHGGSIRGPRTTG